MSWAEEAAHLGVINNSWRDHRHYTEKGRVAEERNHRTSAEREKYGGKVETNPVLKETSGCK